MGGDTKNKRNRDGGSNIGTPNKVSHVDSTEPVVFDSADATVKLAFTAKDVCGHLQKAGIGRVASIRVMASGSLVLVPCNTEQRNQLLRWTRIGSTAVAVRSRQSFNPLLCKKITSVPLEYSDSDMLEEIHQFFPTVKAVRRLGPSSKVVRIDFCTTPPVSTINLWGQDFRIFPFEDRPRQCKKCLRFGHIMSTCRSTVYRCAKCGEDHHSSTCLKEPDCSLCHGKHDAYSKSCPRYLKEYQLRQIQNKENVSLPEARLLAKSYSAAVSGQNTFTPSSNRPTAKPESLSNRTGISGTPNASVTLHGSPNASPDSLLAFIVDVLRSILGAQSDAVDKIDIVLKAAAKHLGSGASAKYISAHLAPTTISSAMPTLDESMLSDGGST